MPEGPEVRELMRRVQARLRPRWQDDPEWEDILSESYLKAWDSYERAKRHGMRSPMAVAVVAGSRWGPSTWLKRWFGDGCRPDSRAYFFHESIEELQAEIDSSDDCPMTWKAALIDPGASPEVLALDRLERRALWIFLRRRATPRQIEALVRFYLAGEGPQQVARHLKISPPAACDARKKALLRCRIAAEELATFPAPATDYPRCTRGHYLAPENVQQSRRPDGRPKRRCRLCSRDAVRRCRHNSGQTAPGAQETARAPHRLSGDTPTKNTRGSPP